MAINILFVDDNDTAMNSLPKQLSKKFVFQRAGSYKEAAGLLNSKGKWAVVITELGLNGENGIAFLSFVRKNFPKTVRIVMSASTKFSDIYEALNTAQVFRYISKPCPPEDLARIIGQGNLQYETGFEKQQAMHKALLGSVNALVDILDLVNPEAMGLSKRIRDRVMNTAKTLGVKSLWQVELAVLLSHVGCVALPSEILEKMDRGEKLSPEERQIFGMHPSIAANLLANIDQMSHVADVIRWQLHACEPDQPIESRIIKVALDLDRLERKGLDTIEILNKMASRANAYDPKVLETMRSLLAPPKAKETRELSPEELEEGMIMAKDLVNKDGTKLLLRGQPISKASLFRLKAFHVALGITDPIEVQA